MNQRTFDRVNSNNPCVHCGKPDWCYRIGELSVCCRDQIADGWYQTSKQDDNGHYYLAQHEQKKNISPQGKTIYKYPDREGKKLIEVTRIDDGEGNKQVFQKYFNGKRWLMGLKDCPAESVPIYRYPEIRVAIANKAERIFIVEGEKSANALWDLGLPATTTKQGLIKWLPEHTQDLFGAKQIILCPDRDRLGLKKMSKVADELDDFSISWLYAPPSEFFWQSTNLPENGGLDIADWIADGAAADQIIESIRDRSLREEIIEPKIRIEETEDNFTQKAYNALYGADDFLSINGELYHWNGSYYERVEEASEKRRIAVWCQTTPVIKRGGGYKYGLATTSKVEEIYKWAVLINAVDLSQINPPGINCKNGVVEINWQGKIPTFTLQPHSPERYYTYCSEVEYNCEASTEMCDRLLAALEPPQREIFLRTIAASLDLKQVRKLNSGDIKALLLQGTGSNGKDSLWQAVATILGESMTQISFSDFQEYDKGRKFNVARLEGARICWASENSEYISLDNLQVLKQAITSEQLTIEQKNAPARLVPVHAVFLFNVNKAPLINAGLEAIKRRYAVLDFNKTYCKDANPNLNQLEADPRFRYDPEFLNTEVAPALLNYVLNALQKVVVEGIDYSCCEGSLERIKKQSNHLWEFADEIGLIADPSGQVFTKDIWEQLKQWYIDNEILTVENGRNFWEQPIRKGDDYVKASRLLYDKLKDIFPAIEKTKSTTHNNPNKAIILGVSQVDPLRQTLSLESSDISPLRQAEAKQGNYTEIKFIISAIDNLTENQCLQLQEKLKNRLLSFGAEKMQKNDENSPDTNIVNLPKLASAPPPSTFQPKRLPKRLPKFASAPDASEGIEQHNCITLSEVFKRKISFVWDDNNECFEAGQVIFPYVKVRKPGARKYETRHLTDFVKVRIDGVDYYLNQTD